MSDSNASPTTTTGTNPANMLGLDYRAEAKQFRYTGPIWDIHSHIWGVEAAEVYLQAADAYGIEKTWTMGALEFMDPMVERYGERFQFIAVPDYRKRDEPDTFTTQWFKDIEGFAQRGCRMCKFWAAPRGREMRDYMRLDSDVYRQAMDIARSCGMTFMTHVADPDTWFATKYADASFFGTKAQQYEPLERLLDEFHDVTWIAAHMGGHPEDLEHLQQLLDDHGNLVLDTSATKWMIRELSRHPDAFRDFVRQNPGRVLFGSDIVANHENIDFDLYASRYWALRTLLETDYAGKSPIIDPDFHMVDPSLPPDTTADLNGAAFEDDLLRQVYIDTPKAVMPVVKNQRV